MATRFLGCLMLAAEVGVCQAPMGRKAGTIEFENDNLRIVHFRFNPRESIRRHEVHPQAVVLLTDHNSRWIAADGNATEHHAKAGQTMWTWGGNYAVQLLNDQSAEMISVQLRKDYGLPRPARLWL